MPSLPPTTLELSHIVWRHCVFFRKKMWKGLKVFWKLSHNISRRIFKKNPKISGTELKYSPCKLPVRHVFESKKRVFFLFFFAKFCWFFGGGSLSGHDKAAVFFWDVLLLLKILIIFRELCMKMPKLGHHFNISSSLVVCGTIVYRSFANFCSKLHFSPFVGASVEFF